MMTRREFMKQALIAGASMPLLLAACQKQDASTVRRNAKAIVVGIDGLDPTLMRHMMEAGELPHFTELARSGTFSPMATSNPAQSPVAWTCLASGNNPGRHGLFDFLVRDPDTYMPELGVLSYRRAFLPGTPFTNPRRCPAMWEFLSDAGIPSTVLRWPITFPPDDISGKILSGLGVPDIKGDLGGYTLYSTQVARSDEPGHDKVVVIDFVDNKTRADISGPMVRGAMGKAPARVPMMITRNPAANRVTIEVQGQTFHLDANRWSPWARLEFKVNPFKSVSGICRFFLNRMSNPFSLYLSPVQIDPSDPCYPISHPKSYAADLKRKFGNFHTLGIPEDTKALMDNRLDDEAFLSLCDTIMTEQETVFRDELENFSRGLLANVFFTTDRIQHIYWAVSDPSHPGYRPDHEKKNREVIKHYYQRMDRILAEVMRRVDTDTLLLVCSDHGFTSFKHAVHLNSWLVESGFMSLHSLPAEDDAEGGPLFQYVDWGRTDAYAVGLGSVYLNLKGREKEGRIEPSRHSPTLDRLMNEIMQWRDPDRGERVVLSAVPGPKIYHGPFAGHAPDLVIGFNSGYRMSWQTALGGTPGRPIEDNVSRWTGDHCVDPSLVPGVFFANRKIEAQNISLLDIAPSVLQHFGVSANMDGRPLTG